MRSLLVSSLVAASLALGGCGLRPLYANGSKGAVAQVLADVDVAPIEGHSGWLVRNALRDRLQATQAGHGAGKRLRLDVRLEDSITGFGVRADDAVTRERRTLRARYKLLDGTTVVVDATAGSDAGIDVVSSESATVAAENSALERLSQTVADQIVARIDEECPPAALCQQDIAGRPAAEPGQAALVDQCREVADSRALAGNGTRVAAAGR